MANSKTVGDTSEAKVLARFIELGWSVSIPFGDNQRYDLILDRGLGLERVQVKTANYRSGVLVFKASSQSHGGSIRFKYTGQADLFGVYAPYNNYVYLLKVSEFSQGEMTLRLESTRNNQEKYVRWAVKYVI